jgi:hypothetical protein
MKMAGVPTENTTVFKPCRLQPLEKGFGVFTLRDDPTVKFRQHAESIKRLETDMAHSALTCCIVEYSRLLQ